MREKITALSESLQALHRRFLENERIESEKLLERKLSSLDFLLLLANEEDFSWLRPFSALIADIDAFLAESETVSSVDAIRIRDQVEKVLRLPDSRISRRFTFYVDHDPEFVLLAAKVHAALSLLSSAGSAEKRKKS